MVISNSFASKSHALGLQSEI